MGALDVEAVAVGVVGGGVVEAGVGLGEEDVVGVGLDEDAVGVGLAAAETVTMAAED